MNNRLFLVPTWQQKLNDAHGSQCLIFVQPKRNNKPSKQDPLRQELICVCAGNVGILIEIVHTENRTKLTCQQLRGRLNAYVALRRINSSSSTTRQKLNLLQLLRRWPPIVNHLINHHRPSGYHRERRCACKKSTPTPTSPMATTKEASHPRNRNPAETGNPETHTATTKNHARTEEN